MMLPIRPPYLPMEATTVDSLPADGEWQYEPKWDGFRCLAFRDGGEIRLQSKSGQPLERYFPEVVAMLRSIGARRFVLDGELVVPVNGILSFDELLQRIHPAHSRVEKLARERAATLIVFDLLVDERGTKLYERELEDRRRRLERFAGRYFPEGGRLRLSPATRRLASAKQWLRAPGTGLDGVIAKRRDAVYRPGLRDAMVKVKRIRTADCVVGGFRYASRAKVIGSLLLGLYDRDGLLHHVGFTSSLTADQRSSLTPKLEKLVKAPGFTGQAPGGPSRWSTRRSSEWQPLRPTLVVEVQYDHYSGARFRHGTKFLRWRPDKAPRQCTMDQVQPARKSALAMLK